MTDEELTAIRERADAATPGPWQQGSTSMYSGRKLVHQDATARKVNPLGWQRACICREARPTDATFIVHARTDIPALLTEVERLRGALAEYVLDNQRQAHLIGELRGEVARLRARAFGYDDAGRITYNGAPYADLTIGTTSAGIARAAAVVAWLNACLAVTP
jgi:hypothetical protein